MQMLTLKLGVFSAGLTAVVYDQIQATTGVELRALLYVAVVLLGIGLFMGCKENKQSMK